MQIIARLLSLSLAATPLLIVFYLVYKLLLASDGRYRFNRIVLAVVPPLAFGALPFTGYVDRLLSPPASGTIRIVSATSMASPSDWILWVYAAGMAVVAALTAVTYIRIALIISRGRKQSCGRFTLVATDRTDIVPFSWMRYIIIPATESPDSTGLIILHETCHLDRHHWLDLLVAQLVIIVNWFNPAAWLLREELKSVHEFQADRAVIASGADARAYQMLLIAKAMGSRFPSLANSLNHSSLKRRIDRMLSRRRQPAFPLRIFAIILSATAALSLLLSPKVETYLRTVEKMGMKVADASPSLDGVSIYLNGSEITYDEMNSLDPKNIRSITVDKHNPGNPLISIEYDK